jgi:hypothetical protein
VALLEVCELCVVCAPLIMFRFYAHEREIFVKNASF